MAVTIATAAARGAPLNHRTLSRIVSSPCPYRPAHGRTFTVGGESSHDRVPSASDARQA
jgi:hypothetical protein